MKSDDELFDIDQPRFRASKKELLADIRAFAKKYPDKKITSIAYDKWLDKRHSRSVITKVFGSFANACVEAEIGYKRKKEYSDKELIRHFEDVWRWRGQRPIQKDLITYNSENGTIIHYSAYDRRWGWAEFVRLFSSFKLGQISYEQLISSKKKKNVRKPISARLRAKILQRDNYSCSDCGASPRKSEGVELEVHHIIPISMGGDNIEANLTTNCRACNSGKSDKILSG